MKSIVENVPLIGIYAPYPQAGKSTLAKYLQDEYGFKIVKMADPLKDMLRAYMRSVGMSETDIQARLEGDKKHEVCQFLFGKTTRYAMQTLGTEWGRDCIGVEFWVRAFLARQFNLREQDYPVVCDDMRFPNEFSAIRASGGLTVRVTRPSIEPPKASWIKRMFSRKGHSSEGSLNQATFDFEAVNDYKNPEDFAKAIGPRVADLAFRHTTR